MHLIFGIVNASNGSGAVYIAKESAFLDKISTFVFELLANYIIAKLSSSAHNLQGYICETMACRSC